MTVVAFGGLENGESLDPSGFFGIGGGSAVVNSSSLITGTYCFEIVPTLAQPTTEFTGFSRAITGNPRHLAIPFKFLMEDADPFFDTPVPILELEDGGIPGSVQLSRRLNLTADKKLQILDSEGEVGIMSNALTAGVVYECFWYVDVRTDSTRDILWVWLAGAWSKVIDVSDAGNSNAHAHFNIGSGAGKVKPEAGGSFYIDDIAVIDLENSPNATALASVLTRYKIPTANGTDSDFDTGAGTSPHPDYTNVNDAAGNHDGSDYDEGDVDDDQVSYICQDAETDEDPLAIQILGVGQMDSTGSNLDIRTYIYDGTTRDYGITKSYFGNWRSLILNPKIYNDVNGTTITETLFNDNYEPGVQMVNVTSGKKLRVSSIGMEYMIEGARALPDDFPVEEVASAFVPKVMTY